MAVTTETTKIAVTLKLNNGTTESGNVKTVSQTLGSINKDTMDIEKAYNIAVAASFILDKGIYAIEQTTTSHINEND